MKHIEWYNSLSKDVQEMLEDWENIGEPNCEYQPHYLLEDIEKAFRLSPITIRQYIREGKIFARKRGRKWLVPIDSVARYLYNSTHNEKAIEYVPMGIVCVWTDTNMNIMMDYRIVSAKELSTFNSVEAIRDFMNLNDKNNYVYELVSAMSYEIFLEDIGLVKRDLSELKNKQKNIKLSYKAFSFSPKQIYQLVELSRKKWYDMPVSLIEEEYKTILGDYPDYDKLRLLRQLLFIYSYAFLENKNELNRMANICQASNEFDEQIFNGGVLNFNKKE